MDVDRETVYRLPLLAGGAVALFIAGAIYQF